MDELVARAYVSWGLWVADCPRPDCLGAEHYGHAPVTGVVGGLTDVGFRCASCGGIYRAEWPPNADDIWHVLSMRPMPNTRNWMLGEELRDLVVENVAHGIEVRGIENPGGVRMLDNRFGDRAIESGLYLPIGA